MPEPACHGPNHCPDNTFTHAPRQQTLMAVDVLEYRSRTSPCPRTSPHGSGARDTAMEYPWRTLMDGHFGRLVVRTDGDIQKQYTADLDAAVYAASATVRLPSVINEIQC